jgi:aldehyde:ferredoxin oxidoreductase
MTAPHGYAGKILRVDLSSRSISHIPTTDYSDRFLGGRGIAAGIYWDEVSPEVKVFDPENRLIFMTGPLGGITGLAGSRWTVCGKSPSTVPEHFSYNNLGGRWGAQVKFAGYDGIVIQGKSDRPVYLFIQDGVTEIRDASALWGKGAVKTRETLKGELGNTVAVAACGPAGENMVRFASLLADNDSSGSNGFGGVMGSKRLKAIAVRGSGKVTAANPQKLEELRKHIRELKSGIVLVNDKRQLAGKQKRDICYGCISGCTRATRIAKDGTQHKYFCASPVIFHEVARMYYEDVGEIPFYATVLLDEYGLDVYAFVTVMTWLLMCNGAGILTEENTGIPMAKIGSMDFLETLVKKISFRDGFGDILAEGLERAADLLGKGSKELIIDYAGKGGRVLADDPRMIIANGLIYAMEPTLARGQQHEIGLTLFYWLYWAGKSESTDLCGMEGSHVSTEVFRKIAKRFWGSELAADFSTYEGKALAAAKIQDREYAKESLILCDFLWPIMHVASGDYVGDPSVESKVLSAVTGKEVDEGGLYRIGERIFNLQRAILVREGHRGRESDVLSEYLYTRPLGSFAGGTENLECLAPGKEGEVTSRKNEVVDRQKFEKMKDEYYKLRGWDVATGLQTRRKLRDLGLGNILQDLDKRGLVK